MLWTDGIQDWMQCSAVWGLLLSETTNMRQATNGFTIYIERMRHVRQEEEKRQGAAIENTHETIPTANPREMNERTNE